MTQDLTTFDDWKASQLPEEFEFLGGKNTLCTNPMQSDS